MSTKTTEKLKAQLATQDVPKALTLDDRLKAQRVEIERALPNNLDADRFARIVLTTVKATPGLRKCSQSSILAGCMLAAQLGLEPGPLGLSYLVPYGKEAQLQIGYKGIIQLARRSGEIKDIQARTVFANDFFEHEYGMNPKLIHRPNHDEQSEPRLYYMVARFKGGGEYVMVAPPWKIEEHRKRSKASNNGPWQTDYEAMAWKTLIHMSKPWLPLSVEANNALALDGVVVNSITKDMVEKEAAERDFIDVDSTEDDEIVVEPADETAAETPTEDDSDSGRPFS